MKRDEYARMLEKKKGEFAGDVTCFSSVQIPRRPFMMTCEVLALCSIVVIFAGFLVAQECCLVPKQHLPCCKGVPKHA